MAIPASSSGTTTRQQPARPGDAEKQRMMEESPYAAEADWRAMFQPMYSALSGDDPRFTQLDHLWDDDDPEEMDPWGKMLGDDSELRAEFQKAARGQKTETPLDAKHNGPWEILEGERRARGERPRPRPGSVLSSEGAFDLNAWTSSVNNGRIPAGALSAVGGTEFLMEAHAAAAMTAMIQAARQDGVALSIGNSYRTYDTQVAMRQAYEQGRGALAADPGTSNHGWGLAADMNITPENHAWLAANAAKFGYSNPFGNSYGAQENWHWEYGQGGSAPNFGVDGKAAAAMTDPMAKKPKPKIKREVAMQDPNMAPALLTGEYGDASFSTVLAEVLMPQEMVTSVKYNAPAFKGPDGAIKRQLYQGFVDAGRMDLARMVGTRAFAAWIGAESGWNPGATSPANNHGMANDGLFQIWRGHDFNSRGQVASMSPYEQAMMVAKYFSLTVEDIRTYAEQIRAGSYSGWG